MNKEKLAIIGASYLQLPLIETAKKMGYETHVFAWAAGDVGESAADVFYPISITETEQILAQCRKIGICGICTIASDLATVAVNHVAAALGLAGNSLACTQCSTNKHAMRRAFEAAGDPSPRSILVDEGTDLGTLALEYPVIVKPTDRSGSRGITRLEDPAGLADAVSKAAEQSFEKKALIEEFAAGQEYSVECVSSRGRHTLVAMTLKYTTGAPHFIETGHLQPAPISPELLEGVQTVVFHALDTLGITQSISHSELKIDAQGRIRIIEIGGRMGGDFIGSDLVHLSTGVDLVRAAVDLAVGKEPDLASVGPSGAAAVRFILKPEDAEKLEQLKQNAPELLVKSFVEPDQNAPVVDSGSRLGYFVIRAEKAEALLPWLPEQRED